MGIELTKTYNFGKMKQGFWEISQDFLEILYLQISFEASKQAL